MFSRFLGWLASFFQRKKDRVAKVEARLDEVRYDLGKLISDAQNKFK